MFADEAIPARRKVIEYTGEHLTPAQAEPRLRRPLHYLFVVDDDLIVDGEVGGSGRRPSITPATRTCASGSTSAISC